MAATDQPQGLGVSEEKLLCMYTATKGWRTRKLQTTEHMIEKIGISFDISSYKETQMAMIQTMRDVAD